MKNLFTLLLAASLFATYAAALADSDLGRIYAPKEGPTTFEPASFKDSKRSLQNRIKFPRSIAKSKQDASYVFRCDALVTRQGRIKQNFCPNGADEGYPYVKMINRAAKASKINPAKVDGTARNAWLQYYVVFMKKGKETSVEVIPNSGLQVDKYGLDYSSPQRYKEGSGTFGAGCGRKNRITVNAVIDEYGVPKEVTALSDNAGPKCLEYLKKTFMEQRYIPAMVNGKAVQAYYSEEIFGHFRPT